MCKENWTALCSPDTSSLIVMLYIDFMIKDGRKSADMFKHNSIKLGAFKDRLENGLHEPNAYSALS